MQSIVIIGGTGFIGRSLLKLYGNNEDYKIHILIRDVNNIDIDIESMQVVQGDLTDEKSLDKLIQPGSIVINLAYISGGNKDINLKAIRVLVEKCKQVGVKRIIHCSSSSVYGAVKTRVVTEETDCHPVKQYEVNKNEIEKILIKECANLIELVILQPTAVFGDGGGENLVKFVKSINAGNSFINYLRACLYGKRRMNLVSVNTVAAAIKYFSEFDAKVEQQIYIVSEDDVQENNYYDIDLAMRKELGLHGFNIPIIPIPYIVLKLVLLMFNRSNTNPNTTFSNNKLVNCGFEKPFTFIDSINSFAKLYKCN